MNDYKLAEIQISYSCDVPKDKRRKIRSSTDAYVIAKAVWNMDTIELQEEFKILLVNRAQEVIGVYFLSKGGITSTIVDPKLVFGIALKCSACGIVLVHNHPSGALRPSSVDLELTRKLKKGGKLLEISVLDHIILTKDGYYSFADEGHL